MSLKLEIFGPKFPQEYLNFKWNLKMIETSPSGLLELAQAVVRRSWLFAFLFILRSLVSRNLRNVLAVVQWLLCFPGSRYISDWAYTKCFNMIHLLVSGIRVQSETRVMLFIQENLSSSQWGWFNRFDQSEPKLTLWWIYLISPWTRNGDFQGPYL